MRTLLILAAGVGLAACGCGGGTVTVTGTVTYNGKPLPGGSVTLVGSDGIVRDGPIGPDGKYVVDEIAVGAVRIGVTGPTSAVANKVPPRGGGGKVEGTRIQPRGEAPAPAANDAPQVPAKFADPLSSGLTGTVTAGKPLDIDVK